MKNYIAMGVAAAAMVVSANPASAATIIAGSQPGLVFGSAPTGDITYPSTSTNDTRITPQWLSGTLDDTLGGTIATGAVTLFTYCIDLKQTSGPGTFNVVSLLSYLGNDTSLYSKFAALIYAEGAIAPGTKDHDAAVQMAVWELRYENVGSYTVSSGNSKVTDLSVPADATLANTMLTAAVAGAGTAHPELKLWVAQNADKQDLLFWTYSPVPEPATWGMMLLGFGAIGRAMRAKRRSATISFS